MFMGKKVHLKIDKEGEYVVNTQDIHSSDRRDSQAMSQILNVIVAQLPAQAAHGNVALGGIHGIQQRGAQLDHDGGANGKVGNVLPGVIAQACFLVVRSRYVPEAGSQHFHGVCVVLDSQELGGFLLEEFFFDALVGDAPLGHPEATPRKLDLVDLFHLALPQFPELLQLGHVLATE